MTIITALFLMISGVFAAIAKVRQNSKPSQLIAVFILGLSTLILSKDFLEDPNGSNQILTFLLITVLGVSFAIGEFTKRNSKNIFLFVPVLLSGIFLFYPELAKHRYMNHPIDDLTVLILIASVSAITPLLIQLLSKFMSKMVNKITPITWSKSDAHLFESGLTLLYIAGIAALGSFLLGKVGILVAGTFFLSSTLIARGKTASTPSLLISSSSGLLLISGVFVLLEQAGYASLDLTNGEVLEGVFMAGFIMIVYELLIRLAQRSEGKWRFLFTFKAFFVPALMLFLLGFAYTQLERLGGVLTLSAVIASMAVVSVIYNAFNKSSNLIGLKLFSLGFILIIAPFFAPVKQSSGIDLGALGIENNANAIKEKGKGQSYHDKLDEPNGQELSSAMGTWEIDSESSKVFFELGPPNGRTSGEFTNIEGEFDVKENIEQSSIEVTLPVKHISTYNSMRDETLMEEDYFHAEKYPKLTFKAKEFNENGDAYKVKGEFSMLGHTNPLELTLKLVGVGEKDHKKIMVLWGKASLDKTDYGMPSSAKIGDVVDFHFEVQLTQ